MPRTRWRVVCGRLEVIEILAPTSALTSVDLPTLGRPTIAIWPQRNALAAVGSGARCLFIRLRRGGLLRGPPARPRSDRRDIQRRDATDHLEYLQMRLAADFDDRVFRHRQPPALQPFLEPRLGILGDRLRIGLGDVVGVKALDRGMGGSVTGVEKDCPELLARCRADDADAAILVAN